MKKYNPILITLTICLLSFSGHFLSSCSESSTESAQDKTRKLLAGNWHVSNVTLDGVNKNDSFADFTLIFSANAFSSTNGEPAWPTSGSWAFTDDTAHSMVRDDDTVVEITSVTEQKLTLTFQWEQNVLGGGRLNTTSGDFVFELRR
jgi:hypothetical protein